MKKIGILTLVLCLICAPQALAMRETTLGILGWFFGVDHEGGAGEDNKIEKNENLNKKSGKADDFVGFVNLGNTCYFDALLSSLFYSEPFASLLLSYKKEICTLFETGLKKLKDEQFGNDAKKKLLNHAQCLAGMAKNNENGSSGEEEVAWDNLLTYFQIQAIEPEQVDELKPLIQAFFLVELLHVAVEIHEKKVAEAVRPEKLALCLSILGKFALNVQQDSSEAANLLFDALELIKDENQQPVLQKIFGFGTCEKFRCLSCGEEFQYALNNHHSCLLPISFPAGASGPVKLRDLLKESDFYGKQKPPRIQLKIEEPKEDSLWESLFSSAKKKIKVSLTQSDKIFEANHCGAGNQQRIRLNSLVANCGYLPELFCIHLKRYIYDELGNTQKTRTPVQIPFELNIDEYLESGGSDGGNYRLKSVILHEGGFGGGHYTSWVRIGKKWREFDDTATWKIDKKSVKKVVLNGDYSGGREPIMLFYERCEK